MYEQKKVGFLYFYFQDMFYTLKWGAIYPIFCDILFEVKFISFLMVLRSRRVTGICNYFIVGVEKCSRDYEEYFLILILIKER